MNATHYLRILREHVVVRKLIVGSILVVWAVLGAKHHPKFERELIFEQLAHWELNGYQSLCAFSGDKEVT